MQLSLLDWKSMYLFAGIRADFKFLLYVGQLGHINIDSILWRYQYSRRTQVMADIIWRFDRNSFFQFACLLRSLLPSILYFLVKDRGGCCPRPFCMRAQGCLAPLSRLVLYNPLLLSSRLMPEYRSESFVQTYCAEKVQYCGSVWLICGFATFRKREAPFTIFIRIILIIFTFSSIARFSCFTIFFF